LAEREEGSSNSSIPLIREERRAAAPGFDGFVIDVPAKGNERSLRVGAALET